MNLIDNVDRLDALAAVVRTMREVFASVEVWTMATPPEAGERRVFILLASASDSPVSAIDVRAPEPARIQALDESYLSSVIAARDAMILTDDHVPLTYLMGFAPVLD